MNVKLTLSMDDSVVEKGKRFAARIDKPLSQIVRDYFVMLDASTGAIVDDVPISSKLQSLVGVGAGSVDESDFRLHLERRHGQSDESPR